MPTGRVKNPRCRVTAEAPNMGTLVLSKAVMCRVIKFVGCVGGTDYYGSTEKTIGVTRRR